MHWQISILNLIIVRANKSMCDVRNKPPKKHTLDKRTNTKRARVFAKHKKTFLTY
jgi:hypothetical protein